jgi:hypothetical protein
MRKWSTSSNEIIRNMTEAMTLKFDKYWTDIQGLMGIATLLDPRYKDDMLNTCFSMLHGVCENDSEIYVREVINMLTKLLEEYHVDEDIPETSKSAEGVPAELMSMFSARVAKRRPATRRLLSELDKYLEDDYVPLDTKNFNVLDWWKVAGTRYPTLRLIARDIYAIPISTVASESAFSTSGRVLSEHHCRLTPDLLEASMCSQDWIRNRYKGTCIEQNL